VFVGGDVVEEVLLDLFFRDVDAGLDVRDGDDVGLRDLVPALVGDPDHRALGDGLVFGEEFLEFAGVDVVAGGVDHVLLRSTIS